MLLNITVTVKPKNRFINLDIDIAFARDIARLTGACHKFIRRSSSTFIVLRRNKHIIHIRPEGR